MADTIPEEVRKLIEEFKRTDPGWQRNFPEKKNEEIEIKKVGTTKDAMNLAILLGFEIKEEGGKHSTHVVDENGKFVCSIPSHPGDLAKGTWNNIVKALETRSGKQIKKK